MPVSLNAPVRCKGLYHTTPVGECLVDIQFAEICQLTLSVSGSQSML